MALREYLRKRDFAQTPEPGAKGVRQKAGHRFVIQKHAASRLHYDFRLEIGGALKSWAVPKGVPYTKGEKRLAVQTEDHPLAYIDFEGRIPKGQYGGGTVMVWDCGTFEPLSKAPAKELAGGKLHFVLHGTKLRGEWYLVRLRDGEQWLLIRGGEDLPPISKKLDDTSALSQRSMRELSKGDRVGESSATKTTKRAKTKRVKPAALPEFIEPMQAKLVAAPPDGEWLYEIKFDGFRALALRGGSQARLLSRNEKDFGGKFPGIMESLLTLPVQDAILDGEIVALDPKGRSSFQLLQAFELGQERPPLFYYAFDLLRLDGKSLLKEPLAARKAQLARLLKKHPGLIRFSAALGDDAPHLLAQARQIGLEGLIGKRPDSVYEPGRRSGAWLKLKLRQEQEFVIGGYTNPDGARLHFGALLVGVYRRGALEFVGKVGTGFNAALLRSLHASFQKIAQDHCPFVNLPEKRPGRWGQGLTPAALKRCHWIAPAMVCQVKYAEWTRDDRLRQPVFLGLRADRNAREVVREKAR